MRALRYRAEYLGFRVLAAVFAALPVEWASTISGNLWRWIAPFTSRHKRALAQLQRAFPEKTAAECDSIARGMWETMGRVFGEFFHLAEIAASDRIVVENRDTMFADLGPDQGFVACSAHQGNWELAVIGLPARPVPVAGLYQKIKNPLIDDWVRREREKLYPGGLFDKGAVSGVRLIRHVKNGGGVAVMADLRDNGGVRVPFFGMDAPSTRFPALLARSRGAPLFAATIVRESGVRFRMRLDPVATPLTIDREADIAQATANLAAAFESSIRKHPEQWMWAHRRWG